MAQAVDIRAYEGNRPGLILAGIPTFGAVSIEWHGHMMQLQTPMNRAVRHLYVKGKEVGHARNEIVQHALHFTGLLGERISHVFFIDDDVLVPPDALTRLLAHKLPIVAGLYYAKTPTPQPLMLGERYEGLKTDWRDGDLVEVYAHGMGCTLIDVDVFRAIGEGPWFQTSNERNLTPEGVPVMWHQTEDVFFLQKAKDAGYKAIVDTGLFCFHYSLAERVGYPLDRWRAATTRPEAVPA